MSFDAWKESSPTDDMPSVEDDRCEEPGCDELATWRTEDDDRVWLCEAHARAYLRATTKEAV